MGSFGTIDRMPTDEILRLLITERDKLNKAIEVLGAGTKRRGRPPGSGAKQPPLGLMPVGKTPHKKRAFSPGTARSSGQAHESILVSEEEGSEIDYPAVALANIG
jgi:hypothetical protein